MKTISKTLNKNSIEIHSLLEKIASEDSENALRFLYMSYYNRLVRYIFLYVKSGEVARELVSDVFLAVWENRKILHTIDNFNSYIYKIAKFKALNYLRDKEPDTINIDEIPIELFAHTKTTPEDQFISEESVNQINNAIEELPPKCKLAFKLIREDNMRYKDAAELLGISIKTLENHLTLAIKKIRSKLK